MKIKQLLLKVYFIFRLPFICILRSILKPVAPASKEIDKILIIRIDRMGDFVTTLPVIENLRLQYPRAVIDVAVKDYIVELAGLVKTIDHVKAYKGLWESGRELRKEKYDLVLDMLCDYRLDSALLAYLTGSPLRVGFKGGYRELFFIASVNPKAYPDHPMPKLNLELLKAIDIPVEIKMAELVLEPKVTVQGTVIAVHPGGYYASQRWNPEKFSALVKRIADAYNVKIMLIGSAQDGKTIEHIRSSVGSDKVCTLVASMKELAFALAGAKLVICNNSGPLHLAAALGVPTVSLMGPTDPIRWWPQGKDQVVIRKELACSPCGLGSCRRHSCLEDITVDEVFEAVKQLLGKPYGIR